MALYKGDTEIQQVYLGDKEIENIYKGETEIWSNNKVIYLGYGTSWNASGVDDYQNFTEDNFFFIRTGSLAYNAYSAGSTPTVYYSTCYYAYGYNTSSGVYTAYALANNATANSNHVVVCTKPEKLTYLGSGTVNISSLYPTEYQNFTVDNFLCKNNRRYWRDLLTSGDEDDSFTAQAQVQISYNATTGVVTANYFVYGTTRGPDHDRDANFTAGMPIYLYKGTIKNLT